MIKGMLAVGSGAAAADPYPVTSTLLDAMTATTGWTCQIGNGASGWTASTPGNIAAEAHEGPSGSTNWLRLYIGTGNYDGTHTGGRIWKTITATDMTLMRTISVYAGIDTSWNVSSNKDRFYAMNITLGSDGDGSFSNSVTAEYVLSSDKIAYSSQIFSLVFARHDFTTLAGAVDWSAINDVRIELYGSTGSIGVEGTSNPVVYLQELRMNKTVKPTVVISHDDGGSGIYSLAKPEWDLRGYKTTQFVIPDSADAGGGNITTAQLVEMYADGHDVCLHATKNGTVLSSFTKAQYAADLALGQSWLSTNGMTRASHICSWPTGVYTCSDGTAIDTAYAGGITVARGSSRGINTDGWSTTDADDAGNPVGYLNLYLRDVDTANSLPADVMHTVLQDIVKLGGIVIFNFHNVLSAGAAGTAINISDYQDAMNIIQDYENRSLIQVKRMSDVFDTDGSLLI